MVFDTQMKAALNGKDFVFSNPNASQTFGCGGFFGVYFKAESRRCSPSISRSRTICP